MSITASRFLMLAKVESTYRTDPTPDAANDAVLVEDVQVRWPADIIDRPGSAATLSREVPLLARARGELTFAFELAGSGAAGTPPDWGPFMRACGFLETISLGTSVTYTPRSTGFESITAYVYKDGILYKMHGCRGSMSFDLPAGGRPMGRCSLQGFPVPITDVSMPSSPTLQGTVPPVVKGAAFSIGGYSAVISSLGIDMQNRVEVGDDVNAADGYSEVRIVERNPLATMNPEAVLVATHNFWSKWTTGAAEALTVTLGSAAGNIIDIDAPKCVRRELNETERAGVLAYEIPMTMAKNVADDEIAIVLT